MNPPGSTRPPDTLASVRVLHRYRIVQECARETKSTSAPCRAVYGNGDSSTVFSLVPVKTRSLRHRVDDRERVEVSVGRDGKLAEPALDIAPGSWRVEWAGYRPRRTFNVDPGRTATIAMETTSGHCELEGVVCRIVPGSVKTVQVSTP